MVLCYRTDRLYREAKAAALESKSPLNEVEDEEDAPVPAKKGKADKKRASSLFDLLGEDGGVDDDEDGGGLMVGPLGCLKTGISH
jgi:hypothetical protein